MRLLLAALVVLLAFVPSMVAVARGVAVREAIGLVEWIVGGICVLGGRLHLAGVRQSRDHGRTRHGQG